MIKVKSLEEKKICPGVFQRLGEAECVFLEHDTQSTNTWRTEGCHCAIERLVTSLKTICGFHILFPNIEQIYTPLQLVECKVCGQHGIHRNIIYFHAVRCYQTILLRVSHSSHSSLINKLSLTPVNSTGSFYNIFS